MATEIVTMATEIVTMATEIVIMATAISDQVDVFVINNKYGVSSV